MSLSAVALRPYSCHHPLENHFRNTRNQQRRDRMKTNCPVYPVQSAQTLCVMETGLHGDKNCKQATVCTCQFDQFTLIYGVIEHFCLVAGGEKSFMKSATDTQPIWHTGRGQKYESVVQWVQSYCTEENPQWETRSTHSYFCNQPRNCTHNHQHQSPAFKSLKNIKYWY